MTLNRESTAFFDCGIGWWGEAEAAQDALSVIVMQFGQSTPVLGLATGRVDPHNHSMQYASEAPLKCQMTFYGKTPLLNVRIPIIVDVLTIVPVENNPNARTAGRRLAELPITIPFKQIEIPTHNVITFYVYGFDVNNAIRIRTPVNYLFETTESSEDKPGRIIKSKSLRFNITYPSPPPPHEDDVGTQR